MSTPRLAHFAINADDVPATCRFYEAVFGWTSAPWGPSGFYKFDVDAAAPGVRAAAVQERRELIEGTRNVGMECTFEVDDVDSVAAAVLANGGRILMDKTAIPGVGDLVWFQDPAGNAVGAMRYDVPAAETDAT